MTAPLKPRLNPYYHGLCGRFGAKKVEHAALAIPVLLQLPVHFALRTSPYIIDTAAWAALYGFASGLAGIATGMIAHHFGNKYASSHGYGLTNGASLVQKFQAAAYALPVAGGLALALMTAPEKAEPVKTESFTHEKTAPVTAAPPVLNR